MKYLHYLIIGWLVLGSWACQEEVLAPQISSVEPDFGSAGQLVVFEGMHLADIKEIRFSDQVVNFNTAYNSNNSLLLRIPTNIPLGPHEVSITTEGGTTTANFRVTLEPPSIFAIDPPFASPGDIVIITGKNFFEPIEVSFFEDIKGDIVNLFPDSMEVIVPDGISKGRVTVDANGGVAISPTDFFSINAIPVNDFDGNGMRSQTNRWGFTGQITQNAQTAIQNSSPAPIDNNYLKLSGQDDLDIGWIGGAQTDFGFPGDDFCTFGITTDINNTLLEMDVNNNGRNNTHLLLILLEKDGLSSDFVYEVPLNQEGWQRISVPLNRFSNFENIIIDPAKVKTLKIHLIDQDNSDTMLEVNVDNIRFVEIL